MSTYKKLSAIALLCTSGIANAGLITIDGSAISDIASTNELIYNINASGQLLGAYNVMVGDKLWDVEFKDDSYANIFSGSFDATSKANAELFSGALGKFVFVDFLNYKFDTDAASTLGCELSGPNNSYNYCQILTPYGLENIDGGKVQVNASGFLNKKNNWQDKTINSQDEKQILKFASLSGVKDQVYADWSQADRQLTSVPEPTSMAMFGMALAMLGGRKLRKNN